MELEFAYYYVAVNYVIETPLSFYATDVTPLNTQLPAWDFVHLLLHLYLENICFENGLIFQFIIFILIWI